MKLLSINIGLPRDVVWRGGTVSTGIFKSPVRGRLFLRTTNLDGDRQADPSVHGGRNKAVYCYPSEHYAWWKRQLPGADLPPGSFGENFTTEGLDEISVHLGDRFRIGAAEVIVTQPRLPCYKLGIKFQDDGMVKRFSDAGKSGFYVAVTKEGEVGAGDAIEPLERDPNAVSIFEINRLYTADVYGAADVTTVRLALQIASLPEGWKKHFLERLESMEPA
jgi:MOSC domain-containing protein YiiM